MRKIICLLISLICYLMDMKDALAMHISEGILPFGWSVLWSIFTVPFIVYGIYRLKRISKRDISFKPLAGFISAVVFVISCMPVPVPIAGTCSHPCGTGISAILVGPAISILIATVALLLQALFLAHGGLSTLGANVTSMGIIGSIAGYLVFKVSRLMKVSIWVAGFMAGLFADWATYLATSAELALGIKGDSGFLPLFTKIVLAFVPTQLPLGILEGMATAGILILLYRRRPDILIKMHIL